MDILTYKRPHKSKTERKFIHRFLSPYGMKKDGFGNLYLTVGADKPVTMFSCHTDTVHDEGGLQDICFDAEGGFLYKEEAFREDVPAKGKSKKKKAFKYISDCLGADDGTGIWMMLNMIDAGVEGLYFFHRGEECGGLGSSWSAEHNRELLKDIKHAIAFDRHYYEDVITHQGGDRCASDDFADELARQLNKGTGLKYVKDCTGVFTDTANYTDIIPECTNLSVGYYSQHSNYEMQDVNHALIMLDRLKKIDFYRLPVRRDPELERRLEMASYRSSSTSTKVFGGSVFTQDIDDYYYGNIMDSGNSKGSALDEDPIFFDLDDVKDFIWNNPEGAAELLWEMYNKTYK